MKKSLFALAAMAAIGDIGVFSTRKSFDGERGHALRALDAGGTMANVDSATLNNNTFMQAFGDATLPSGKITLTANPTNGDTLRILRIPAGTKVRALIVANDQVDSNGSPTAVVSIGYAYCDSADGAAVTDYFAAAGQTVLQTANAGKVYANFDEITFEKDVYITMTMATHAATLVNPSNIRVSVVGTARGVK